MLCPPYLVFFREPIGDRWPELNLSARQILAKMRFSGIGDFSLAENRVFLNYFHGL